MRLRTFEAFFLLKNGLLYTYPMLHHSIDTDIVVVGAGVTGALISNALVEAGYKTVLIDKLDVGLGSTSATTAMLQYEIDVPLYKLSKMIGEERAAMCYKAGVEAIHDLEALVRKCPIDCEFQKKQSLYFAHDAKAKNQLEVEYLLRERHQLGVKWLDGEQIFDTYGICCEGGILSETAASIDAYRLAHELIHFNTKRGLQVYDQTTIEDISYNDNGVVVKIVGDNTIRAKKIVFCTGFEATRMLKEKVAKLFYTWACVSEEDIAVKKELHNLLVWDTEAPYFYMRTTLDGRMLMGGEDSALSNSTSKQELKDKKARRLIKKLGRLMPSVYFEEDFSWGGVFGTTKDGLPYIGASPEYKNAYFVLGFGGNGITFSVQGMKLLTELLEGKETALARCYRFGR